MVYAPFLFREITIPCRLQISFTFPIFCSRLILECGAQFTQKLEGMFKDIDISQDFIKSFKDQRHTTLLERGLHVNVLSQSWWPTYPDKQVILPEGMVQALESFKEFWLKKQSGRKLMWRHALGHCILSAEFPKVFTPPDESFGMQRTVLTWVLGEEGIECEFVSGRCVAVV